SRTPSQGELDLVVVPIYHEADGPLTRLGPHLDQELPQRGRLLLECLLGGVALDQDRLVPDQLSIPGIIPPPPPPPPQTPPPAPLPPHPQPPGEGRRPTHVLPEHLQGLPDPALLLPLAQGFAVAVRTRDEEHQQGRLLLVRVEIRHPRPPTLQHPTFCPESQ